MVPDYADSSLSKLPSPSTRSIRRQPCPSDLAHDTAQMVIQAYRASVSFVDAQVGRVLRALKETDLKTTRWSCFYDHGITSENMAIGRSKRCLKRQRGCPSSSETQTN